jgi:hypothetical protein
MSGRSWRGTGWGVEEYVEEHQDTNIACVVGTGQKMDRAQDTTLTNNRGTRQSERATRVMACTTHNTQTQVYLGWWQESSEPTALPLSPAAGGGVRSAKACIRQGETSRSSAASSLRSTSNRLE